MEISTDGKTWVERWAFISLACVNIVIAPVVGWFVTNDIRDNLELSQAELAQVSTRLAQFELQSREASEQMHRSIILSNHITAKEAVISAIEKSIPSVEIINTISERDNSYVFKFDIRNTSSVSVLCDWPRAYMNRGASEGRENGEVNLTKEGYYPAFPGVLAPGATYSTWWHTPDTDGVYWMNFAGSCSVIEFRMDAIRKIAEEVDVNLEGVEFTFNFDRWFNAGGM